MLGRAKDPGLGLDSHGGDRGKEMMIIVYDYLLYTTPAIEVGKLVLMGEANLVKSGRGRAKRWI